MSSVFLVADDSGEYEQWDWSIRGVFATKELAEAHAATVRETDTYLNEVGVQEWDVLEQLPQRVKRHRWAAHIEPDGTEDRGSGYERSSFDTFSHECAPLASSRLARWSGLHKPDLYIEVVGSDAALVKAEYARLLAEARERLNSLVATASESEERGADSPPEG